MTWDEKRTTNQAPGLVYPGLEYDAPHFPQFPVREGFYPTEIFGNTGSPGPSSRFLVSGVIPTAYDFETPGVPLWFFAIGGWTILQINEISTPAANARTEAMYMLRPRHPVMIAPNKRVFGRFLGVNSTSNNMTIWASQSPNRQ